MPSLHSQFRRDLEHAWVTVAPNVQLKCSLLDTRSMAWSKVYNRVSQPFKQELQFDTLGDKKARELLVRTFVEVCCVDWRTVSIREEDGKTEYRQEWEISDNEWKKFDRETAVMIFTLYPRLYAQAVDAASQLTTFQLSDAERKN